MLLFLILASEPAVRVCATRAYVFVGLDRMLHRWTDDYIIVDFAIVLEFLMTRLKTIFDAIVAFEALWATIANMSVFMAFLAFGILEDITVLNEMTDFFAEFARWRSNTACAEIVSMFFAETADRRRTLTLIVCFSFRQFAVFANCSNTRIIRALIRMFNVAIDAKEFWTTGNRSTKCSRLLCGLNGFRVSLFHFADFVVF